MNSHDLYVTAAYACAALGIGGLIFWVVFDYRNRRREMAQLQASGVRRRSDHSGTVS